MISNHSLSSAEFDSLAAGDPDTTVIGKLVAGQLSKRIVMILAILELAAQRCPGTSAALDTAYSLLARAQAKDALAVRDVLTHPGVGAWAAGCIRDLQVEGEPADSLDVDVAQFAAIAAAAAVRARLAFAVQVPLRDRAVMLPTLGLAKFGPGDAAAATVSFSGGHIRIDAGDQSVAVPADPAEDGPGWHGMRKLRSQVRHSAVIVDLEDVDPARDGHGGDLAPRTSRAGLDAWQSALDQTWEILVTQCPRRADALAGILRAVVPLRPQAGKDGVSSTSRDAIGAIVMTPAADPLRLADTLIHETQHSVLYALADLVALHHPGSPAEYYSPWRDDPRPIEGLLHGAYAYLGVVDFWRSQRDVLTGSGFLYANFEFARWRHQVSRAARALLDSGYLTAEGVTFVQGMAATAARWLDLPIDHDIQQLADRTTADHWTRWRVRNHRPDHVMVAAAADAWLAHLPCPTDPRAIPVVVVPQQRKLSLSDRVHLCLTRLQDPAALDRTAARAADVAYVSDDFAAASRSYRAGIARDPEDIENWAGLALTLAATDVASGLSATPEVAQAIYLDLARKSAAPDIGALDLWLTEAAAGTDHAVSVSGARE